MDTPSFLLKIVHLLYHILDKMAKIIGIIYGKMIFDQMRPLLTLGHLIGIIAIEWMMYTSKEEVKDDE